jgi:hypothetical protein
MAMMSALQQSAARWLNSKLLLTLKSFAQFNVIAVSTRKRLSHAVAVHKPSVRPRRTT